MNFDVVPAHKWRLDGKLESARTDRLLKTRFNEIVHQVIEQATLHSCRCKQVKRISAKRAALVLQLPSTIVDLFHNGAGGYRASFFQAIATGEAANRFIIDSLLPLLKRLCAEQSEQNCSWELVKASLGHKDAKTWIHEGAWLTDNKECDRNLSVNRWERNADRVGLQHRFQATWAMLTPENETRLEIKGGCVGESFVPIDIYLKPSRSQELHDHGYT